ncbi:hypothetical protein BDR26DRAFT_921100 [Obelidium mucronatum]|nr:hypothetical protein BDR26DRAFT_921100 [Obelidium mucronatum]
MSIIPATWEELKDNSKLTYKDYKIITEPEEPKAWKGSSMTASTVLLLCLGVLPFGVICMMILGATNAGFTSVWNAADCAILVAFNVFKFFAVQRAAPGWITTFIYLHFANYVVGIGFTYFMIRLAIKLRNHAVDLRRLVKAAKQAQAEVAAAAKAAKETPESTSVVINA